MDTSVLADLLTDSPVLCKYWILVKRIYEERKFTGLDGERKLRESVLLVFFEVDDNECFTKYKWTQYPDPKDFALKYEDH